MAAYRLPTVNMVSSVAIYCLVACTQLNGFKCCYLLLGCLHIVKWFQVLLLIAWLLAHS